jgi:PAS domain S-box-containing protein
MPSDFIGTKKNSLTPEELLEESHRFYEELIASVPLGVYRFTIGDGGRVVFEYVSGRLCEILELDRDAVLADSQNVINVIHPEERAKFAQAKSEAIRERLAFAWEGRALIRGETRWLHFECRPTLLAGHPPFWTGVVFEVTAHKQAEEAMRQQHSLLQGTLESTADGILAVSADGHITGYNRQFVELWRVPSSVLTAPNASTLAEFIVQQLNNPEAMPSRNRDLADTSKAETFDTLEFADGRVFERFSRPQFVEGQVVGRVWSFRDVTARHWAAASLRESEHKFKMLFEAANDAILIAAADNVIIDCNRKTETMFGTPREKIIGCCPANLSPERQADGRLSAEAANERNRAALAGVPQFFEWIHARADGSLFNAEVSLNPVELRGQMVVQSIVRDITARKQAEAALREAEELYRTLVNTSPDGICVLDGEGCVIFASPRDVELYGLASPAGKLGRTGLEFVAEKDQPRAQQILGEVLAGNKTNERLTMLRQDGSQFIAEVTGMPLRDALGMPRGVMFVIRDVTEQQRQHEELENKNAELERFTYTVSHDLKSPLITIKGFATAVMNDVAAGNTSRITEDLKRIAAAADKMGDLLNGLLELSRVGRIVNLPTTVSMSGLARETVELLAGAITQRGAKVTVQPGLPDAFGDAGRLQEVWQNLLENALKFAAPGAPPEIEIGFKKLPGAESRLPTDKQAAGSSEIASREPPAGNLQTVYFVRDHGCGIEARFQEMIFGLFNKLETKTEGAGIGLALARRIVEFHGGTIWVESAGAGRGATFYFTLAGHRAT